MLLDFVEECGKAAAGVVYPVLVDLKGPNPIEFENGYVAFEDLPADKRKSPDDADYDEDDFDDEEEDEEDSDTEEVYDEDEE